MRVLALDLDSRDVAASELPTIHAVARVDVICSPALGDSFGQLMSASRTLPGAVLNPFVGARLRNAIVNPCRPDFLVAAHSATRDAIPLDLRRGLPWIIVLRSWRRLQPSVPTFMLDVLWEHGEYGTQQAGPCAAAEREARFTAHALQRLLGYASPEELEALSRNGAEP